MSRAASRLALATVVVAVVSMIGPLGVLATTLTPPPPASATCQVSPDGTICMWDETFKTPFPVPYGVACDGFTVKVNLAGERQVTAFYDVNGALVRRIRHSSYEGTLINSVTGASVPHIGHFTIFDDLVAGTTTITGMLSRTVVGGEGLVWRNIGRIVMSSQNGAVLSEAGEHGTWDVVSDPSTSTELCAALS